MGFKAGKKLIAGERKCLKSVSRGRTDDCGVSVFHEQRILDLSAERFISGGDELRNERSADLSLVETGRRERHRWSEFCQEIWYLWACEGTSVRLNRHIREHRCTTLWDIFSTIRRHDGHHLFHASTYSCTSFSREFFFFIFFLFFDGERLQTCDAENDNITLSGKEGRAPTEGTRVPVASGRQAR